MNAEIDKKTGRIAGMLERDGLSGLLINGQHNFAWITGGASNRVDHSRENGVASILVTSSGERYLLANNIEMPRMLSEEISADDFEPVEFTWQNEKSSSLVERACKIAGGELATDITIDVGIRSIETQLAKCRYELTPEEIERFRELGEDAGKAMRDVFDKISPGETEMEIAAKMRWELAAFGIESVVTMVAADTRIGKFRHPVPTQNKWQKTVMLVTCAKRSGLIASLTRIACIGAVPDELRDKTEASAFVYASLLDATRKGATGVELYEAAARAYTESGFADEINKHHQGGAAGYRTRDWIAHPASRDVVKTNQAFAWNPSITGTKVEETIIVTENGIETITTSPDFPAISTTVEGVELLSPGILGIMD